MAVLTRRLPKTPSAEVRDGVAVQRVGADLAWLPPFTPIRDELFLAATGRQYRRLRASFRPDVAVAHPFALAAATLPTRRHPLVSIFYAPAGAEYRVQWRDLSGKRAGPLGTVYAAVRQRLRDQYHRAVVTESDRVLTMSHYSASLLSTWLPHLAKDRVRLLPGGVDLDRLRPAPDRAAARRRLGLPADVPLLLSVRRLAPRMGLEDLLVACSSLRDLEPSLLIVGKGPLEPALRRRARDLGIADHVRFAGGVTPERLIDYYQAADLFVLPTLTLEAFGLVTLEALACGTPVVATRVGANPELLDPLDPQLLVPVSDPAALAQTLRSLLQRGPALDSLRVACRNYVENTFSWERTAQSLVETCREVLDAPANG